MFLHQMTDRYMRILRYISVFMKVKITRGDAIGMVRVTPWEAIVVAADVAVKAAHVEVGFMDRFCGTLILTGGFTEVMTAVEEVVRFFHETLKFDVCEIHRS